MTSHQLAALLLALPDLPVLLDGYEGGATELSAALPAWYIPDEHAGIAYFGPHDVHREESSARAALDWKQKWESSNLEAPLPCIYLPRGG